MSVNPQDVWRAPHIMNAAEQTFLRSAKNLDAARAFAQYGLPHRRIENWRWSDVRAQLSDTIGLQNASETGMRKLLDNVEGYTIAKPDQILPDGIDTTSPASCTKMDSPLALLATSNSDNAQKLVVKSGHKLTQPLILYSKANQTNIATHRRLELELEADAEAILIEIFEGDAQAAFLNHATDISLGVNAHLTRLTLQDVGADVCAISSTRIDMADTARLTQGGLGFGGGLNRIESHIYAASDNHIEISDAYILDDKRHQDFTSRIHLSGLNTEVIQTARGAVFDQGKGIFQGKFHVERAAQKTDAAMGHKALRLSPNAAIFGKPELEIYADDVQCAHGNALGELDMDSLFYLRQRGLPMHEAKALLIKAYLAESYINLPDPWHTLLLEALDKRLEKIT